MKVDLQCIQRTRSLKIWTNSYVNASSEENCLLLICDTTVQHLFAFLVHELQQLAAELPHHTRFAEIPAHIRAISRLFHLLILVSTNAGCGNVLCPQLPLY